MSRLEQTLDSVRMAIEDLLEEMRAESRDDMVEVVVEIEAVDGPPIQRKRAFVSTRRVRFNNGTGSAHARPGTRHLNWDVQGRPGQEYRIAITAPESARWERTSHITADGDDSGIHEFEIR